MTNLFPKIPKATSLGKIPLLCIKNKHHQRGVITLTITSAVLISASLMTMYSSKSTRMEHQIYNNDYTAKQAFEAAEAGLEYGLKYLEQNKDTILVDGDNDGTIDATNTKLSNSQQNNSIYSIAFSNPVANDTTLIKVTVSGASGDGKSSKQITQLVKYYPALDNMRMPQVAFTGKGSVDLQGNPTIKNTEQSVALWSGSGVTMNGSAVVTTEGGPKGKKSITGLVENDVNLKNSSEDDLFTNYFGNNKSYVKKNAANFFMFTSDTNVLDGLENKFVWFDGDLSIDGNTTIGTNTKPVILVVNGNLNMTGTTKIEGFVFVTGDFFTGIGTSELNGALVVKGNSTLQGTSKINYSSDVLNRLGQEQGLFAKVPGSWKDS